jgi:hypothetical protein
LQRFVVDRRFWVADGRESDFELIFGREGIWQDFLRRAPGYVGTEIERKSRTERRYRVRDCWNWHRDFELFREKFSADYERFERLIAAEGLVEREQFIGAYYEKKPGNGDELVRG